MVLFRMLSMKLHQTHVNIIYWRPDKTSAIENDLYSFTLFYVLLIQSYFGMEIMTFFNNSIIGIQM